MSEVAWLIEFTPSPEPLYLCAERGGAVDLFDRDHAKAVRFSRKEDAEKILRILQVALRYDSETEWHHRVVPFASDCYAITEHMWCDKSPALETEVGCICEPFRKEGYTPNPGCPVHALNR